MIILFPMAGFGSRFKDYSDPKPFIKIKDRYMVDYAISSLSIPGKYYCIVKNDLNDTYIEILKKIFKDNNIDGEVIKLLHDTRGQSETCFEGIKLISNIPDDDQLVITNCDQFTPWDPTKLIKCLSYDGAVSTFKHRDVKIGEKSKYSHVLLDDNGIAIEFAEKLAISDISLNGIFYWKTVKSFVDSFIDHRNEFNKNPYSKELYVSLTYNYLIKQNKKITIFEMDSNEFFSLGTPEDIDFNFKNL